MTSKHLWIIWHDNKIPQIRIFFLVLRFAIILCTYAQAHVVGYYYYCSSINIQWKLQPCHHQHKWCVSFLLLLLLTFLFFPNVIRKWFDLNWMCDDDDNDECNWKKSNTKNHSIHLIFRIGGNDNVCVTFQSFWCQKINPIREPNETIRMAMDSNGKSLERGRRRKTIITIWFSPTLFKFWVMVSVLFLAFFFAIEHFFLSGRFAHDDSVLLANMR